MNGNLIVQSIGSGDDFFAPWLALSRPVHENYAAACGADYLLFAGEKDGLHPAWNRIPLILDALWQGYRKVVWLDADSLVVDPSVDIFAETDDVVPLQMTRVLDAHVEMPWGVEGWDAYNDGVLVVNDSDEARDALDYVWSHRRSPLRPHHHPQLWECNWVLDWVLAHPESVGLLDVRFNWMAFRENLHCAGEAVICSWHGIPREERWELFSAKFADTYGVAA